MDMIAGFGPPHPIVAHQGAIVWSFRLGIYHSYFIHALGRLSPAHAPVALETHWSTVPVRRVTRPCSTAYALPGLHTGAHRGTHVSCVQTTRVYRTPRPSGLCWGVLTPVLLPLHKTTAQKPLLLENLCCWKTSAAQHPPLLSSTTSATWKRPLPEHLRCLKTSAARKPQLPDDVRRQKAARGTACRLAWARFRWDRAAPVHISHLFQGSCTFKEEQAGLSTLLLRWTTRNNFLKNSFLAPRRSNWHI